MRKRKCSMCDYKDTCAINPLTCKKEFITFEKNELEKHDSELLDKVVQKQRTIIDEDGVMYKVVFLKDIEDLKEEASE